MRKNTDLRYLHQDQLTGTALEEENAGLKRMVARQALLASLNQLDE